MVKWILVLVLKNELIEFSYDDDINKVENEE